MSLSPDSFTMLLLCSQLGLSGDSPKPLTVREWNPLARNLQAAGLRPSELLNALAISVNPKLTNIEVNRLAELLSRQDPLQRELGRLAHFGIFPLTRADSDYPQRYRLRLKDSAPPVLFYAGEKALLGQPGIAVVGSRHLDDAGRECAQFIGNACGISGQVLYSGGAKGVDTFSMDSALEARGTAVGVLAVSLEKTIRMHKDALQRGDLCLLTPYSPNAGFSVGAAMGRNRLIYAIADYAVVVSSSAESGGTWAGAIEALKNSWVPVFVLTHKNTPDGNRLLLQKGALPFPYPFKEPPLKLPAWLKEKTAGLPKQPSQPKLF